LKNQLTPSEFAADPDQATAVLLRHLQHVRRRRPGRLLLDLNLACAAKEKAGEKITPPGLSLPEKDHAAFLTEDCIQLPTI
jgi:hypothetical protein